VSAYTAVPFAQACRPITGDVLIGQLAITLSGDEVLELMREHDVVAAAQYGTHGDQTIY